ncbi:MAG: hypothetical protein IJF61_04025 [Clostridia bacterium]|nr:hypothetical protein [Clostridia bacterium]
MQMLYLIRDFESKTAKTEAQSSGERLWQWQAVERAAAVLRLEYEKRPNKFGTLKPLHAFFDYAYFSFMFTPNGRDMGAAKRSWNLYRSRFAYLVAEMLGLVTNASESRHDG